MDAAVSSGSEVMVMVMMPVSHPPRKMERRGDEGALEEIH